MEIATLILAYFGLVVAAVVLACIALIGLAIILSRLGFGRK